MKQDQKSYFYNVKKSRSGQAVVEYVLLLVVIVGMILGTAKVFKSIDKGMNKYIGDYFVCLMEYGELPTLGVSDPDLKRHASGSGRKCDNQFDAFTFESGRPATAGGGGGNGSGTNGKDSDSANNGKGGNGSDGRGGSTGDSDSKKVSDKNGSGNSDGSNSGSDQASNGRSGSGSSKRPEVRRAGTGMGTLDGVAEEQSNVKVIDEDGESDSEKSKRKRNRPRRTQIGYAEDYKAIGGKALQEIERAQIRRGISRKPTSSVLKIVADEEVTGPTRKPINPPMSISNAEYKDKDNGFSVGGFFKWLLIAAMVVAIVIFFGGQLLNYSNSDS